MSLSSTAWHIFLLKPLSMKKQETMSAASAIQAWLSAESKSFTALCGERFTHGEVILTGIGTMAIIYLAIVGAWIASWLAGGAA